MRFILHHPENQRLLRAGFTLIELLVVVAIIGLLASVIVVSLGSSRSGARDARRAADVAQLRTALELYASDNANVFPAALSNLAPVYIPAVPTDPNGVSYSYCRGTTTRTYGLGITIEEAGGDILKGSVALASMPAGCTAATNFAPNITCEAFSGTATRYCVSS